MKPLPDDVQEYKRTPEFREDTVPAGLLRRHATRAGVWGRIEVVEGALEYRILEPELETHRIEAGSFGVVEPEVPHEVSPLGRVRFSVAFLRHPHPEEGA